MNLALKEMLKKSLRTRVTYYRFTELPRPNLLIVYLIIDPPFHDKKPSSPSRRICFRCDVFSRTITRQTRRRAAVFVEERKNSTSAISCPTEILLEVQARTQRDNHATKSVHLPRRAAITPYVRIIISARACKGSRDEISPRYHPGPINPLYYCCVHHLALAQLIVRP